VLILGIDTSGRQGSVALLQEQGGELTQLGLSHLSGGQYSELLLSSIAALLDRQGLQKSSIGLIAVASGPGSFTGVRIAIATAKGLAEAFSIPVVAVSVLEAIADASGAEGRVIAVIDAQRSETFWGEYNPSFVSEALATFADFTARFASALDAAPAKIFTPDAALAARLREAHVDASVLAISSAEDFARIAYRKFLAGVRADVATLDANYLRRSDAEIFVAPKPGLTPQ
jgi:tRNA threonylcarbamoyladenosine biosynthesis protein TsaB